ncbi:hypothetical protein E2C01_029312 [Portunus trituberculatus]|uniref:Uncharacterized protein n=1 Tax=Portunus trituberculatus TaxID=210409 RepID=A0A5B7ER50_PORTR|nr:hypothetical protein [Portunus trituberculatus]
MVPLTVYEVVVEVTSHHHQHHSATHLGFLAGDTSESAGLLSAGWGDRVGEEASPTPPSSRPAFTFTSTSSSVGCGVCQQMDRTPPSSRHFDTTPMSRVSVWVARRPLMVVMVTCHLIGFLLGVPEWVFGVVGGCGSVRLHRCTTGRLDHPAVGSDPWCGGPPLPPSTSCQPSLPVESTESSHHAPNTPATEAPPTFKSPSHLNPPGGEARREAQRFPPPCLVLPATAAAAARLSQCTRQDKVHLSSSSLLLRRPVYPRGLCYGYSGRVGACLVFPFTRASESKGEHQKRGGEERSVRDGGPP